jgi:predicted ArsR family transcriptional regulator
MPFKVHRFESSLATHVDSAVKDRLMAGCEGYDTLKSPAEKARWIGGLMDRLEDEVGERVAKEIMVDCGRQCIARSALKRAHGLWQEAEDVDDFLDKLNQAHIGGGNLRREGDVIYGSYGRCYCGSVSQAKERLSSVYCSCSCGWYKELFETALERPVEVELLDSIVQGAEACRFTIRI